jgi:hypothetical protein
LAQPSSAEIIEPTQTTIAFRFAGVGTVNWKPDKDYTLVGAIIAGGSAFLLSTDPNLVPGDLSGAGNTDQLRDVVLLYGGQTIVRPNLRVPISGGKDYYVACTNIGSLVLYLISS